MSPRLSSALFLSLSLAACGGGASDDAQFSTASDVQIVRALQAASGADASSALAIGGELAGEDDQTRCPRAATTGNQTVITGGCDDPNTHLHWEGQIVDDNMLPSSPSHDASKPGTVTYDGFRVSGTDNNGNAVDIRIDGTVSESGDGANLDTDDLSVVYAGVEVQSAVHLVVGSDGKITPSAASSIDIDGLGGATIEGTWTLQDPLTGTLTLHGADDLVFDLDGEDPSTQCVPYTIGDQTGSACPSS